MNCPKCGTLNEQGAAFCYNCGAKFDAEPPKPPVNEASQAQPLNAEMAQNQQAPMQPNQQPYVPIHYQIPTKDNSLRCIAFFTMLCTTIGVGWTLIPLAWMIPLTVHAWRVYKGTRPHGTAFGIITLIFCNLLAGILLLCSTKEK